MTLGETRNFRSLLLKCERAKKRAEELEKENEELKKKIEELIKNKGENK